jgi:hypothetical protein
MNNLNAENSALRPRITSTVIPLFSRLLYFQGEMKCFTQVFADHPVEVPVQGKEPEKDLPIEEREQVLTGVLEETASV